MSLSVDVLRLVPNIETGCNRRPTPRASFDLFYYLEELSEESTTTVRPVY
jgi:hypothetical protein